MGGKRREAMAILTRRFLRNPTDTEIAAHLVVSSGNDYRP